MYQYDKHLDFHALGREIKRKREEKGWTQEYLAQLVDRTPRSIMYMENRGQKPSLNVFYQLVTLLEISVQASMFFTSLSPCWRFPWINSFSRTSSTERAPAGNR